MNELQRIPADQSAAVTAHNPQDLLALAVEKGADVATLERLMVVRTQLKAEAARDAYFRDLSAFQAKCPMIIKTQPGHENRYRYAPLEKIVIEVAPLLQEFGFAHQEDGIVTDGWVEAIVSVTHREGHTETKRFKVPTDSKAGMSPQQKYGAAMTYATRYAFCAAFGIRTGERDTDCPPAGENVTELKKQLWDLLKPVRGTESNWNAARQWLVDEMCLDPDIPISQLDAPGLKATIAAATKRLKTH